MKRVMVTGANRGIGLEFVSQLLGRGDRVIAACRQPESATALQELAQGANDQLSIVQLDVTDEASVKAARAAVGELTDAIDLLINNAGILQSDGRLEAFQPEVMRQTFNVNSVGPMLVASQFADLVKKGNDPQIINISSQLGSLQAVSPGWTLYSYNASKAALNMITRMQANELKSAGVTVVTAHPGWVQTDMGGPNAAVTPPDSAGGLLTLSDRLTMADSGEFFTWQGEKHVW